MPESLAQGDECFEAILDDLAKQGRLTYDLNGTPLEIRSHCDEQGRWHETTHPVVLTEKKSMDTPTDLERFTGVLTKFGLNPHIRFAANATEVALQSGRGGVGGEQADSVEAGFLFDRQGSFVDVTLSYGAL